MPVTRKNEWNAIEIDYYIDSIYTDALYALTNFIRGGSKQSCEIELDLHL